MNDRNKSQMGFDPATLDITDATFMKYLDDMIHFSRTMAEGSKSMMPGVIVFARRWSTETGTFGDIEVLVMAVSDDFNEDSKKRKIMKQIGAKLCRDELAPVALFMTSEAWMSRQSKEPAKPFVQPRHDPNKKEVIMIGGRTVLGDCKAMAIIGLSRDAESRMRLDGTVEKMTDAERIDTRLLDCVLLGMVDPATELIEGAFTELTDLDKHKEKPEGDSK